MPLCGKAEFLRRVKESRDHYAFDFDFRTWTENFAARALGLLFPHFSSNPAESSIDREIDELGSLLCEAIAALHTPTLDAGRVRSAFCAALPDIYDLLIIDAEAFYRDDPAAESVDEVIFAYPGFYTVALHRVAHVLCEQQVPFLPRLLSEHAHGRTGIDIHPGAKLGRAFFIDHGTGIVIGETAVVGDNVKIYQGVTLGAHYVHKRLSGVKRHPTIGNGVVIYAHATILGGSTVVGDRTVVGANSWITQSVPADSVVSHRTTVQEVKKQESYEIIDFNI